MIFKQQVVIEFESYLESKAFRKWLKLNGGKQSHRHINNVCNEHAVSLTTHGEHLMRQYASLQEITS